MNIISLNQAIDLILNKKIVAIPTETVYGLFGLATSKKAVDSVYKIKNRPSDNPLICHFWKLEQIEKYTTEIPKNTKKLINYFSPGPVTYLLNLQENSPLSPACLNLQTICCRIPNHALALELLQKINTPLFGPSANTSTKVSGTGPDMIQIDLGDKIAGILDGKQSEIGLESTILDCREDDKISILRAGKIGKTEIDNFLRINNITNIKVIEKAKTKTVTPGSKYRHYSPDTPIYSIDSINKIPENEDSICILGFSEDIENLQKVISNQELEKNYTFIELGSTANLDAVGKNLFKNFFQVDNLKVKKAYFLESDFGNSSIAKAIQSKLDKILINE